MILVQWSCKVPKEESQSFFDFAIKKLKPLYESHGCRRYELFTPMDTRKKYFPYQITQEGNRYTEQLVFDDVKDFENLLKSIEGDSQSRQIIQEYEREFNVSSCNFIILTQKV